jgi:hypothetical protein
MAERVPKIARKIGRALLLRDQVCKNHALRIEVRREMPRLYPIGSLRTTPRWSRIFLQSRCGDLRRTKTVLEASKVRTRNRDEVTGCRSKA